MSRHGNGEEVTAHAGLPLIVEAARAVRLEEVVEAKLTVAKHQRGFSEMEKLEALIQLVASGGDRIEDIRILAEDKGWCGCWIGSSRRPSSIRWS